MLTFHVVLIEDVGKQVDYQLKNTSQSSDHFLQSISGQLIILCVTRLRKIPDSRLRFGDFLNIIASYFFSTKIFFFC